VKPPLRANVRNGFDPGDSVAVDANEEMVPLQDLVVLANSAADNATELERLRGLVRELREAAFEPRYAHEREWETEEQERLREEGNKRAKADYDAATEAMLRERL
jgi:hypothetical protein